MTLSIITLCIECHHAECQYAECHISYIFMLNVIMLSVVAPEIWFHCIGRTLRHNNNYYASLKILTPKSSITIKCLEIYNLNV
jgi:hypothetical protein